MAITKGQLKSIVKECLLEILSEGIGTSSAKEVFESKKQVKNIAPPAKMTKGQPAPTQFLKEAIKREAGGNPVMADILADTAMTTLPSMLENDRSKVVAQPTGVVEKVVAAATPDQLFGEEVASKWASLAFMDPPKK